MIQKTFLSIKIYCFQQLSNPCAEIDISSDLSQEKTWYTVALNERDKKMKHQTLHQYLAKVIY
jgi:hypothetical protein